MPGEKLEKKIVEKQVQGEIYGKKTINKSNKHKIIAFSFMGFFIVVAIIFFFFSETFTGFFVALDESIKTQVSIFVVGVFVFFLVLVAFVLYWYMNLTSDV